MATLKEQLAQRIKSLEPEEIMELTPQMQVTARARPAKPGQPLSAAKKPAHRTIAPRYLRGTHLRQLLGITEVARLPFELEEPRYGCSSLLAVSRELTISCTLLTRLYESLGAFKPEARETSRQGDWNLCLQCIKAERDIRDRLLSVEARLETEQRNSGSMRRN